MTFTKSHSELFLLFQQYKEARLNAGQPLLKCFETNNVQGDQRFMENHFLELKDGVVPYDKGPDGCMKATISEGSTYLSTLALLPTAGLDPLSTATCL
jgi:hypothetical protein